MVQPDNQHIVKSQLKNAELRFICWTKPDVKENFCSKNTLCAMPIDEAIEQARQFGLTTVMYQSTICDIGEQDTKARMEECIKRV
ncbi:unnamed protein product [Orchesella dallaii]|uniref:Uncharacterized protein n=1 Tax=Orchesella dallaii TaxID=48710 RepID=A0ABP1QJA4_9HEXA